jgi:hypothetical protein
MPINAWDILISSRLAFGMLVERFGVAAVKIRKKQQIYHAVEVVFIARFTSQLFQDLDRILRHQVFWRTFGPMADSIFVT